eukprot:365865-Chlamydomonas_euryale.AAC.10
MGKGAGVYQLCGAPKTNVEQRSFVCGEGVRSFVCGEGAWRLCALVVTLTCVWVWRGESRKGWCEGALCPASAPAPAIRSALYGHPGVAAARVVGRRQVHAR